jgi:serine-type D-Ala-D-Ala endopeptidase (penicillin-binding protein 7)
MKTGGRNTVLAWGRVVLLASCIAGGAGRALAEPWSPADEPHSLKSSAVLVVDEQTGEVLYGKNTSAVVPIASITKLMTAMVTLDAGLPMDEMVAITDDDVDTYKGTRSRLPVGTQLSRADMLHLALMASENRAASALGNSYPGGIAAFIAAMNAKATELGMNDSRYVEPTGLSSDNVSSATDLAKLAAAAKNYPEIRAYTTSPSHEVEVRGRKVAFNNTNGLVRSGDWDIGVSKTGYIREAGRCLVMQARAGARSVIIVLLDSWGSFTRIADAARIRAWLEPGYSMPSLNAKAGGRPAAKPAAKSATVKRVVAAPASAATPKSKNNDNGRVKVEIKAPKAR